MKLILGVIDQPYTSWDGGKKAARPRKGTGKRTRATKAKKGGGRTVTTGDVAGWLEDRYHPMEVFFNVDGGCISALEESVQDAIEDVLMGAPGGDPFGAATTGIEARFKAFLSNRVMETLGIPGVPTLAALEGRSSRFKRLRGPRRPSFIDTGLYQASFKAWVE